jgi:putative thioredoxin
MSTANSRPGPTPGSMNLRGAVDLSALKNRPATPAAPAPAAPAAAGADAGAGSGTSAAGTYVLDVTDQTFSQVVQLSAQVPVVIDLWADWCQPCKQLTPVLEKVAADYGGRILLAKIDVDANPQIAQAFQVQSIPTVMAVLKGQPIPLFQGSLPEEQVRAYIDELLKVAEANGVTGTLNESAGGAAADEQTELPPLHQEAFDAIEAGDYATAAAAYRKALAEQPADAEARTGLAQVELMQRVEGMDSAQVRRDAAENQDSLEAQLAVADLDAVGGHVEDAFARLVGFVGRSAGDDREAARARLVELFDVVGASDERVAKARAALARALF